MGIAFDKKTTSEKSRCNYRFIFITFNDTVEDEESLLDGIQQTYPMHLEALKAMGMRGRKWLIRNRQWETLAENYLTIMQKLVYS